MKTIDEILDDYATVAYLYERMNPDKPTTNIMGIAHAKAKTELEKLMAAERLDERSKTTFELMEAGVPDSTSNDNYLEIWGKRIVELEAKVRGESEG